MTLPTSLAFTVCVAPKRRAACSLEGNVSTAMIWPAPHILQPWMVFSPTPPQPTTQQMDPGWTLARFMAAPTPVVTPQLTSAPFSRGVSSPTLTIAFALTTAYSAMHPRAVHGKKFVPSGLVIEPIGKVAPLPVHRAGRPALHMWPLPQGETSVSTTLSPTFHAPGPLDNPGPNASRVPAPSCPSTMGMGCGILPDMKDTSEWQSPHAWIFTRT
mmetsp:Transcript_58408/g.131585  ORF Transcript_58408/g.131585 Transcript_58408/m.131585 type:complete len:214 (-) Transcript_58408:173-814(-)